MAEQVKVTSIDALEAFRASLIVFLTTAHRCVDEVGDEVRRTRGWVQHDQRLHWEGQLRARKRKLDQAQGELMTARLSGLRDSTSAQQAAVTKAKRAVAEAEEKLHLVKLWARDFDHKLEPHTKTLESLRHLLDHDLPKGVAYLVKAQKTLDAYTERSASPEPASSPSTELDAGAPESDVSSESSPA